MINPTFWVAVSFLIFILVLIYFKVPKLIKKTIDEKINETKNEVDESEKLKDESKNLLSEYENKLNQAVKETTKIIDDARKESENSLIETNKKFHQLLDNKKKALNQKINQVKEDAIKEVKNTSIKVAIKATEKVMRDSIDKKKLETFYNDGLNETKLAFKKIII